MKNVLITFCLLLTPFLHGQDLQGAWTTLASNEEGVQLKHTLTFTGGFFSEAIFQKANGKFVATNGGNYILNGGAIEFSYEFSTKNPEIVGETQSKSYTVKNGTLELGQTTWSRIDNGTPGDLFGAWLISGRKRDGKIVKRDTSGPRKTMKILSGTRFQWIAYNTETKEFMGTGGGTYTTIDGKYTENIGFFSRDDSRVGASLEFNYELKDGDWHHSGLSSKGSPIYEVWSKRSQ
ncbi:membrane or secreted protein [Muricauda sp. 334s03]|uniref:Membrane or secreted protein n=1 Tax=Flagellimonas yonaguniensis TaxID=3031325 RepID=A0ABT5XVZ5_9FLAO|nr:membrane or secreted protein [[Muricauda] yonaguniensis]MDF0715017.1 membrane or secreted protein [[Muricauda] yonaguniensis]